MQAEDRKSRALGRPRGLSPGIADIYLSKPSAQMSSTITLYPEVTHGFSHRSDLWPILHQEPQMRERVREHERR